mgnify:CR=1 FL=1
MSTANKDYIGIIKNLNGCVKFVKEEIQQKTALVNDLKAMVENPNRTIFDLKSRMDSEFVPSARNSVNYIYPYSYSDAYVCGVSYPKTPSYDEYKTEMDKMREDLTSKYEDMYKSMKEESLQEFNAKVKECVESEIEGVVCNRKKIFYSDCTRFCQAYSYATLLRELKNDPDVKMWSTDTVGWTNLSYQITDDIKINIYTNFGYGSSSYFYLGLTYKGIDILPYNMFVTYYYADRRDIARYTRLYAANRDSWDYAFDFVETVAGKAAEGDESFAAEYVLKEVQEMLSGLRSILDNPKDYFDTHIACKNGEVDSHYLTVHNMNRNEINTYMAYPHEMIDVFQAEKISGALAFVEKITALEPIYDQAIAAADKIRDMARKFVPQLENNIARIATDVERLQAEVDELSHQIQTLDLDIEPHTAEIDALYEKKLGEVEVGKTVYRSDIERDYSNIHPEYAALVMKRYGKLAERSKVGNEKSNRKAFLSSLEQCRKEIENNSAE